MGPIPQDLVSCFVSEAKQKSYKVYSPCNGNPISPACRQAGSELGKYHFLYSLGNVCEHPFRSLIQKAKLSIADGTPYGSSTPCSYFVSTFVLQNLWQGLALVQVFPAHLLGGETIRGIVSRLTEIFYE